MSIHPAKHQTCTSCSSITTLNTGAVISAATKNQCLAGMNSMPCLAQEVQLWIFVKPIGGTIIKFRLTLIAEQLIVIIIIINRQADLQKKLVWSRIQS